METYDLLIVGGGINGCAIAREAAMRGARLLLVEKDDLGQHTSSASSKLIHGGLRYLEFYEFRLVRESLRERAIMLRTAPHIVTPLAFVLPHAPGMRPWWMVGAGLTLYGWLARGGGLPRPRKVRRKEAALAAPLKPGVATKLASYWDAWVDDARLVVLNAVAAAEHGAEIATRTELLSAERREGRWIATLSDEREVAANALVNAAGPWVAELLNERLRHRSKGGVRLIKGSHIVVPRVTEGVHAYLLQQPAGRVVFALPYGEHSLIGTTDVPVESPDEAVIEQSEIDYLCAAANRYFVRQIAPADVVSTFSGIRSLFDDGAETAREVTRDYRLELDESDGAALLSVFGGKITTARALAQAAADKLGIEGRSKTARTELPGGDVTPGFNFYLQQIGQNLPADLVLRLSRAYGTRMTRILRAQGLGRHFGAGLYEAEVRYLREQEFARTAEDILWRRTKLGLAMTAEEQAGLAAFMGG